MTKKNKIIFIIITILILAVIGILFYMSLPIKLNNNSSEFATFSNIEYSPGINLDILMPTTKKYEKTPVIIFYHGGGFFDGDKSEISNSIRKATTKGLLDAGWAIVSANYFLARNPVSSFPMCTEDCQVAAKWVFDNADKYGFDINNVGLWGTSAGANLAMMVGFENKEKYNFIIDEFGPTNLNIYRKPDILGLLKRRANNASPIFLVEANEPNMLLIHGGADLVVPIEQTEVLIKKLIENGNTNFKFLSYPEVKHNLKGLTDEEKKELTKEIILFVNTNYIID